MFTNATVHSFLSSNTYEIYSLQQAKGVSALIDERLTLDTKPNSQSILIHNQADPSE